MVSVRAMCSMLVLGFNVSMCVLSSGTKARFFPNFFLFRIMCVGYLLAIWEKDSISLWILELGICSSWRSLTIVVCIVFLIPIVIIMGGSIIQTSLDKSGWRMAYFQVFGWWLMQGIYCCCK